MTRAELVEDLEDGRPGGVADHHLDAQPLVQEMIRDVAAFLERWIPRYQDFQRSYLTVAIGCTGGQHRSVHMTEKLAQALKQHHEPVLTRHNETPPQHSTAS